MRRKLILLAGALLAGAALHGQVPQFGVLKVESDSLVNFIRHNVEKNVYFIKDEADVQSYTVRTNPEDFLEAAFKALTDAGYSVTKYDGKYFILKGTGLATELPSSFFAKSRTIDEDDTFVKYLDTENMVVTYQNKIYEIGDPAVKKSGKATVRGYVRDMTTGEPMVGVSVYDDVSKVYTSTDAYGFYKIVLPIGENTLGFSGYSLEDLKLSLMVYDDGGLDVTMKEKVFSLTGATVTSESNIRHRSPQMGIERIRISEIKNVPVSFGEADVVKVVMTLPGVKSVGEAASGFNVRGGSTDQNLILFNDNTIYNPNHMFGILSSFNPDVVNDVELYKSSIPAEYGGRISSVMEVRSRDGNSKKLAGSVGIGLLTSRLHLEGPLAKDRTTFNLGARTTYSNWILKLLPKDSEYAGGAASFQDVNLSLNHKINENNSIHAYGYYSRDKFNFTNDTSFRYQNINASMKWRSNFSERHSMVFSFGYDDYGYGIEDKHNDYNAYALDSRIRQGFAKITFKSLIGDRNTLTYGLHGLYYDLKPGTYKAVGTSSLINEKALPTENAIEASAYVSDTWNITDKFSLDGGIRFSYFVPKGQTKNYGGPEFRVSGKYSFAENISVKAGFNTMRQYIHMITSSVTISPTDVWMLSNDKVKPQTGWQAAGGFYASFANNTVDFSVEGYYKKMDDFVDYMSGAKLVMNENLADFLVATRGKAYGVEVLLKKSIGKLNGWVSYTYSRTMLQEKEDRGLATINNGEWYNAPYDKPHDVKLVGNYKFTHRYSISANVDYSTGRPVTLPVGKYQYAGGNRLVYSDRNGYRIPDYFRLDLALIIEPGHYLKRLAHMAVTLGCYNVTGRKNPYSIYYTAESGSAIKGHMMSVFATQIPYINLDLKF